MGNQFEWVNTEKLKPNPKNPNSHPPEQIERLCEIIKAYGWRHPIIVSNQTGYVVVGHGRLEAAKAMSEERVPVHYQDFKDESEEYGFMVADNGIANWAELNLAAINAEIPSLGPDFDINLLGIKDFELEPADKYADKDADEVPEVAEPIVKSGELWILGNHRLLCGDCTKKEDVERLMSGQRADMVYTDPPYGMNLDTRYKDAGYECTNFKRTRHNWKPIEGDDKDFDPKHLLNLCDETFIFGADYFCQVLPKNGSWVVWDKRGNEAGDRSIGSGFELCWSKTQHKREICRVLWNGVYGFNKKVDGDQRTHPTQKPVKLAEWFFDRWGKDKTNIVDLYLGSGSTLIACEKTNRRCFGIEIDPHYCSVIIERWAKFTGKDPIRESDGLTLSEIKKLQVN